MKVGSLVECVNSHGMRECKPLIKGEIYTIRGFTYNGTGVLLEEVINITDKRTNIEWGYYATRFREVQPPIDLTALLEESKFLTLKDVV